MTPRERIVKLETQHGEIARKLEAIHADIKDGRRDLKEHMDKEEIAQSKVDRRLDSVEKEQEKTKTHFRWMYGIFGAVQSVVCAWLGLK